MGGSSIDLHVGELETFTVRRSWFWKRLTIRTISGAEYSVGGLRHASAVQLREGVFESARNYAAEQAPRLLHLDDQLRRVLSGDTFVRKSHAARLQVDIARDAATLRRVGAGPIH